MFVFCGAVITALSMYSSAYSADAFTVTGYTVSTNPAPNTEVKLKANVVVNTTVEDVIVDLEVYNSANKQVHQEFFENQKLSKGKTNSYETVWTPKQPEDYVFKIGIFDSGWTKNIYWKDRACKIPIKDQSQQTSKN